MRHWWGADTDTHPELPSLIRRIETMKQYGLTKEQIYLEVCPVDEELFFMAYCAAADRDWMKDIQGYSSKVRGSVCRSLTGFWRALNQVSGAIGE